MSSRNWARPFCPISYTERRLGALALVGGHFAAYAFVRTALTEVVGDAPLRAIGLLVYWGLAFGGVWVALQTWVAPRIDVVFDAAGRGCCALPRTRPTPDPDPCSTSPAWHYPGCSSK